MRRLKTQKRLPLILLVIAILIYSGTSFSYEYFDYNKWPITKRNTTNLKKEIITYYDKDSNPIEQFESTFDTEGFLIERVYTCVFLKEQSKKHKYYYKNNLLSYEEEYDYRDKLISSCKYEFIGTSKIIISSHSDSNKRFERIYEYDNKGLLEIEKTPIDEYEVMYEYDDHRNVVKVTFKGPDGVEGNKIDIEYDKKGRILRENKVRFTYYEDGRIKERIPLEDKANYRLIKYEFIYYANQK